MKEKKSSEGKRQREAEREREAKRKGDIEIDIKRHKQIQIVSEIVNVRDKTGVNYREKKQKKEKIRRSKE